MVGICIIPFCLLQALDTKKINSFNSMKIQVELHFLKLVCWCRKVIDQAQNSSHHC